MSDWTTLLVDLPIPRRPRRARLDLAIAVLRRRATVKIVIRPTEAGVLLDSVTIATARHELEQGPIAKLIR